MISDECDRLLNLCRREGLQIVTAESCTGGLIGGALTEIAGSSDVFWGGFITYANDAKTRLLDVSPDLLDRCGAVSEEVVRQMALGALDRSGAGLALAVSGVAGPGGGSDEKPVGTVWIAAALGKDRALAVQSLFPGDRRSVREATVKYSVALAEKLILTHSLLDSE